jgi:hypothetical protein
MSEVETPVEVESEEQNQVETQVVDAPAEEHVESPEASAEATAAEVPEVAAEAEPAAEEDNVAEQDEAAAWDKAERDHYEAIKEQEREVAEREAEMEEAAEEHKNAKKRFERADEYLRDLIRRGPALPPKPDPQRQLPFGEEAPAAPTAASEPVDNSWRLVTIEELTLNERQVDLLHEGGVSTIGELEDLRAGAGLTSLNGIGQGNADRIEEAVLNWLSANRDKAALESARGGAPAPESAAEPEPGLQWPSGLQPATFSYLESQGITTPEQAVDWHSAGFTFLDIPGINGDQAQILLEFAEIVKGSRQPAAPANWEQIALDDSGFCKRARTALEKAQLTTMGEVYAWVQAGNRFESLDAVGGPTAQKTAAVLEVFCREHGIESPFAAAQDQDDDDAEPTDEELEDAADQELDETEDAEFVDDPLDDDYFADMDEEPAEVEE